MLHDNVVNWNKKELINTDTAFYVLTRFNQRWPDRYKTEEEFQAWSDLRSKYFRAFCVPGVKSQYIAPRAWYVLFDESWRERDPELRSMADMDIFRPVFIPRSVSFSRTYPWFVETYLTPDMQGAEFVAGIRLDSDDTLSRYFVSFLDDCLAYARKVKQPPLALNFPYQVRVADRRVYVYVATDSAHSVLWERLSGAKTPYWASHTRIWEQFSIVECATRFPMVAVHGHDNNVGEFAWRDLIAIENGEQVAAKFFAFEFPEA